MSESCIFCKIIKGDIPSFCIYEDDMFKVILDRYPAAKGHVLIITKEHYKNIFELPTEVANRIYPLAKKIATKVKDTVNAEGINIIQNNGEVAGQSVYHFHLHIIPRFKGDKVVLNQSSNTDMTLEELEETYNQLKF